MGPRGLGPWAQGPRGLGPNKNKDVPKMYQENKKMYQTYEDVPIKQKSLLLALWTQLCFSVWDCGRLKNVCLSKE